MKSRSINPILFVLAAVLCALAYTVIGVFFRSAGIYAFLFNRGLYQPLSLTFFFFGLLLVLHRWRRFGQDNVALAGGLPAGEVSRDGALELANRIAISHGSTILGRRIANLLRGYSRNEEIGSLEERLAAKDRNELDQSMSLVGWVRSLPPLIGLLGTLDGLRGGIAEISMISSANDLEALRGRLQLFAQHASTAFDTTLLGIGAAAVLSAAIFVVRRNEDAHLAEVDSAAGDLARKFPHPSEAGGPIADAVDETISSLNAHFERLMRSCAGPLVQQFSGELQRGFSGAVSECLAVWREELSRTSREILARIDDRNSASVAALEQALMRPRPVELRISANGEKVQAGAYER